MTTEPITTKAQQIAAAAKSDAVAIAARATALIITTPEELTTSGALLVEIARQKKAAKASLKTITDPLKEADQAARLLFLPTFQGLDAADDTVRGAVGTYQRAERQKAADAQAIVDAAARREREALADRAASHQEAGREERAEVLEERVAETTAPVVPATPKVAGVSTRVSWKAELEPGGLKKLAAAVAAGEQPESLIMANMPALNALAKGSREGMAVPGVRAVKTEGLAVRS